MVIKVSSNDAAIDTTIGAASLRDSIKAVLAAAVPDMTEKIAMIKEYFACLDGEPDSWARFEPMLRRTVHPDVVIETSNEDDNMGYDDLAALVRDKFIPSGCISELVDIHDKGDGTLTITVNNHLPGEHGDITLQKVYFKDGKVIRVTSTVEFSDMLDRVSALEKASAVKNIDAVVVLYRRFLTSFNGTSSSAAKVNGLFDDLFDESFVLVTEDGNKEYEDFRSFIISIVTDKQRIRVDAVEAIASNKIKVKFDVGKEDHYVKVDRIATVENGKIVRSEPVANVDDNSFTKIFNSTI